MRRCVNDHRNNKKKSNEEKKMNWQVLVNRCKIKRMKIWLFGCHLIRARFFFVCIVCVCVKQRWQIEWSYSCLLLRLVQGQLNETQLLVLLLFIQFQLHPSLFHCSISDKTFFAFYLRFICDSNICGLDRSSFRHYCNRFMCS